MYTSGVAPYAYSNPWDVSFEQRIDLLTRGKYRVAYYYATPDTSTFRYRAYNVSQVLALGPEESIVSASWFTARDFERMGRVLDSCDALVLCRNSLYNSKVARLAARARMLGRRIYFDVDDLVFDPSYTHLLMDTLNVDLNNDGVWDYWHAYIGRAGATFQLADAAIVTNEFLAARAREWSGKEAKILPNFYNKEQGDISGEIWKCKERDLWSRDDSIHLAYFSGSPSHDRDFSLIADPVARIMDFDSRVRLTIVGFLNNATSLSRHSDRVTILSLKDFVNLQREIGAVEINLVPLQDNLFTNCKSELKYFEAAIVGALTVASPTHAYRDAIKQGENGFLSAAHKWKETLEHVISLFDSGSQREIICRSRQHAIARYDWRSQKEKIESVFL